MAVIYRVNMSDLSVRSEEASKTYAELGGRGLTSAIVGAEVPATCHPLSARNKLVAILADIVPGFRHSRRYVNTETAVARVRVVG